MSVVPRRNVAGPGGGTSVIRPIGGAPFGPGRERWVRWTRSMKVSTGGWVGRRRPGLV